MVHVRDNGGLGNPNGQDPVKIWPVILKNPKKGRYLQYGKFKILSL
jgi:hypothetical protein